jgi:uncharacterized protein (DUF1501 family)
MKRRRFLGNLLVLGAAEAITGILAPPGWVIREAQALSGKTLVVVFLRGGCDGLNVVVPHGDDTYHRLRPGIRIPAPGPGAVYPAIDLDGFFGLHPALDGLAERFFEGQVALLPAVHHPEATRSHFEGQDYLERAGVFDGAGWLNRHLAAMGADGTGFEGLALGRGVPLALRGNVPVGSLSSLVSATLSADPLEEARLLDILGRHYDQGAASSSAAERLIRDSGAVALEQIGLLRSMNPESYQPAAGASYPAGDLGQRLRDIAFLVKQGVGLEVATIDFGGWDTHFAQGAGEPDGRQALLLASLGAGIQALLTDLGSLAGQVCVLVMSEFGRTAAQNGSGGTDHGNAAAWIVAGGGVRGGLYLGAQGWPGLEPDQLREGRDLMHTIDYRDVLAEILVGHLGSTRLAGVLPGHVRTPVGFMGA